MKQIGFTKDDLKMIVTIDNNVAMPEVYVRDEKAPNGWSRYSDIQIGNYDIMLELRVAEFKPIAFEAIDKLQGKTSNG